MKYDRNRIYDDNNGPENFIMPKKQNAKKVMIRVIYDPNVITKDDILEHIDHRMRGILDVKESVDILDIMKKVRKEQMEGPYASGLFGDD